jgi:hypothetical protein
VIIIDSEILMRLHVLGSFDYEKVIFGTVSVCSGPEALCLLETAMSELLIALYSVTMVNGQRIQFFSKVKKFSR